MLLVCINYLFKYINNKYIIKEDTGSFKFVLYHLFINKLLPMFSQLHCALNKKTTLPPSAQV